MGLLLALGIGALIVVGNWVISGGTTWKGLVEMAPVLVISGRLALIGLGELSFIAAVCGLYINMRLWKII